METKKHPHKAVPCNPYRSPLFRRVGPYKVLTKEMADTGLVMEWWKKKELFHVNIFHTSTLDPKTKAIAGRSPVFPASQLNSEMSVPNYRVTDFEGLPYLPLDLLFISLFRTGIANRHFMEAVREFPHQEQPPSKHHAAPQRGNLSDHVEDNGFELFISDAGMKINNQFLHQIFWWANPKCPIYAAGLLVGFEPTLTATWECVRNDEMAVEFTDELTRLYPDPLKIIRPEALARMRQIADSHTEEEEYSPENVPVDELAQIRTFPGPK